MDILCGKKAMQAKEARGRNFFSLVLTMSCYRQTCTQTITGRNLKYLRALEILQNEEYSDFGARMGYRNQSLNSVLSK